MNIVQKTLKVKSEDYYKTHLSIINAIFPIFMTGKEIEVLAAFMALDTSIVEDYRFNTLARKKVMAKLRLDPGGLGNHLKALIKKDLLYKNPTTGLIFISEFLIPDNSIQGYQIKIIKE